MMQFNQKNNQQSPSGLSLFFEDKKKIEAGIMKSLRHIGNPSVREAAGHLLSAGGKMLRSSLVTTAYKAVGGQADEKIFPVAAALELVHTWSLVHDDIIDKSITRRGVTTVHEKWNTNTAILAGDALSNLVYLLIARSGFPGSLLQEVFQCVAEANLQLIDGEMLDIEFETRTDVREQDYLSMINAKTGALITCAAKVGALLGTRNPDFIRAMENYGAKIGTAFQIKDDLIDLTGDEEETGKDFAGDIREGKKTLLLIHALENASRADAKRLAEITTSGSPTLSAIYEAIDMMRKAGSFDYAEAMLSKLIDEALSSVRQLPDSGYCRALVELAEFIGETKKIKIEHPLYTI